MELRHLRYFVTVAEELNVSRASARLHISQPAVSRQIRDLEDELGVELFRRGKSGLKLTAAGEAFLERARDLLRRSNEAVKEIAALRDHANETIVVGYIPSVLARVLTPALRKFSEIRRDVEVQLREMPPGEQVEELRKSSLDIALIGNPCAGLDREFALTLLRRIPLQAVLSDTHRLATRTRVALADLANEAFIGLSEEAFPGRIFAIRAACQDAGFTPRFKHRADNLTALLALVASGKGVTLAPDEVGVLAHPHAVFIALEPPVPEVISVAAVRKDGQSEAVQELLALCTAAGGAIPNQRLRARQKRAGPS